MEGFLTLPRMRAISRVVLVGEEALSMLGPSELGGGVSRPVMLGLGLLLMLGFSLSALRLRAIGVLGACMMSGFLVRGGTASTGVEVEG